MDTQIDGALDAVWIGNSPLRELCELPVLKYCSLSFHQRSESEVVGEL